MSAATSNITRRHAVSDRPYHVPSVKQFGHPLQPKFQSSLRPAADTKPDVISQSIAAAGQEEDAVWIRQKVPGELVAVDAICQPGQTDQARLGFVPG